MARQRRRNTGSDSNTNATPNTNDQGGHKMAGLTAADIKALLSKTSTKGGYVIRLNEFLASGEMGVCANDWVEYDGKKAATLSQGFKSAISNKDASDGSEHVKVITNEEKVYLVNLTAAAEELGEEVAA